MKLFLNVEKSEVFAYEEDGSQDHLIPESYKAITQEEAAQIIANKQATSTPQPLIVSRFQARAALYQANLLDDIEAYMALETTDFFTKLAWKEAAEFKRTSPLVTEVGVLLGLTEVQLDDLFRFASTITA